jgi:uncharacterized membrane protein
MSDPDRDTVPTRETVVVTDSGGDRGGGSGAIIAIVLLLIVLIVGYMLYRNGVFSGGGSKDINVKIDTPATSTK